MTTVATVAAQLIVDASKFIAGMGKAEKSTDSFASKMNKIGDKMQRIGGEMTVGLTLPIIAFGASAVKSAMESEAAITELDTILKTVGKTVGVTSKEIQDYAAAMQKVTKFSDEEIIQGTSMLLTFTKIGKDVLPKAQGAMLDLAQFMGTDARQAALMLGKALNDPIAGMGALSRAGLKFSDAETVAITKMVQMGDIAGAQNLILQALSAQGVTGLATAFGTTFAGQLAIFNNKLDDMKEKIGVQLIPSLIRFMDALTPLINMISKATPAQIDFGIALVGIVAAAGPVISILGTLAKVVAFFSVGGAGASVIPFLTSVGAAILALNPPVLLIIASLTLFFLLWKNWDKLGVTIKQLGYLMGYVFKQIWTTIKQLGSIFVTSFKGIGMAIDWLMNKWDAFVAKLKNFKLPAVIMPGSPTPFEMGLRGISSAMDTISKKSLPKMTMGLNVSQGVTGVGGGQNVSIVDNRRFSAGMGAEELRTALDNKLNALAGQL